MHSYLIQTLNTDLTPKYALTIVGRQKDGRVFVVCDGRGASDHLICNCHAGKSINNDISN